MEISFFVEGAIPFEKFSEEMQKNAAGGNTGAETTFAGIVRSDVVEGKQVRAIDYSAYTEMAETEFQNVTNTILTKYKDVKILKILHSIGLVKVNEVSLLVFVAAGHRLQAFQALAETVDLIKEKVPIWKKEIFDDETAIWKENEK